LLRPFRPVVTALSGDATISGLKGRVGAPEWGVLPQSCGFAELSGPLEKILKCWWLASLAFTGSRP